jgi:hypothetical protein
MALPLGRFGTVAVGVAALFGVVLVWGALEDVWFAATRRTGQATVVRYVQERRSEPVRQTVRLADGRSETRSTSRSFEVMSPVLEYTVDGRRMEFTATGSSMEKRYPIGAAVPIHYGRFDAGRAAITYDDWSLASAIPSFVAGAVVLGMALGVMVLFGGWHVHWNRWFPRHPVPRHFA